MKMQVATPSADISPCAALHALAIVAQNEREQAVLADLYRTFMANIRLSIQCGITSITLHREGPQMMISTNPE